MALDEEFMGFSEGGDTASESASEAASESREASSKKAAAAGQAAKKQKKKEFIAKKRDYSLATLLSTFLKSGKTVLHQQLLVTCLQLVEDDVSPTFILSILSLLFPELERILMLSGDERSSAIEQQQQLFVRRSIALATTSTVAFDIHHFPSEMQSQVKAWIKVMQNAIEDSTEDERSLLVVNNQIHPSVSRLTVFILEEFLRHNRLDATFQAVESFASSVIAVVLRK